MSIHCWWPNWKIANYKQLDNNFGRPALWEHHWEEIEYSLNRWRKMVDPNRKINRLSDDDAAFLRECEQEFRNRFTDDDSEYSEFCAKGTRPPPIVEPWHVNRRQNFGGRGGRDGGSGGGGGNHNWRNNHRNRGGGGGGRYHQNNYNAHNHRRHDGGDRGGPSQYRHKPY